MAQPGGTLATLPGACGRATILSTLRRGPLHREERPLDNRRKLCGDGQHR